MGIPTREANLTGIPEFWQKHLVNVGKVHGILPRQTPTARSPTGNNRLRYIPGMHANPHQPKTFATQSPASTVTSPKHPLGTVCRDPLAPLFAAASLAVIFGWLPADLHAQNRDPLSKPAQPVQSAATNAPVLLVADGLNQDGSLVRNYQRGLRYATDYFGNHGPYYVYLLGPNSEQSVRRIFRQRAISRVDPESTLSAEQQIERYLKSPNVVAEIDAVLSGKSEGGLTWTQDPPVLYEDVTTNARGREKDPIENTWGALHEYHHVFQMAHCDTKQERTSDHHINSWMAEGMATYSSAKFMENLGLINFKNYMLQLRTTGGNIGRPGINDFLTGTETWRLDKESYWDTGESPQVYYMLGAWATAYLIHVQGVEEVVVLRNWYYDIPRIGKSAAFKKHMGLSLAEFHEEFRAFIQQSDEKVMLIFQPQGRGKP